MGSYGNIENRQPGGPNDYSIAEHDATGGKKWCKVVRRIEEVNIKVHANMKKRSRSDT